MATRTSSKTPVTNKRVMAQWVAALRSGRYRQGRGGLRVLDENGDWMYDPLGVLCDLAVQQRKGVRWRGSSIVEGAGDMEWTKDFFLPDAVIRWAGLSTMSPKLGGRAMVDLNDKEGWTFAQIADALEKEWLV